MPNTRKPDAITLLKQDHRTVEELFEKFESSNGKSTKAKIAQQICMELTIHQIIEEEIFYPAVKELIEEEIHDEAYVEHDGSKVLIAEILAGSPEEAFYDAKVKVLSEMIKHHVKEEEQRDGMFAQAKANGAELEALGEQLSARKEELVAAFNRSGLPPPETKVMKGAKVRHGELAEA
jgi:hypothetical protein